MALAALLVLGACSRSDPERAAPSPTTAPGPDPATTTTSVPAPTTTVIAVPATPTCPAVPARAAPREDRPRYVLRVDVRPAENVVTGNVEVRFRPDLATDRLVFRLWPNAPRTTAAGARLDVTSVRVGAHPAEARRPDPTTLVVPLAGGLRAGQEVSASVGFTLTLPGPVDDRVSRTGDAIRLGSFFPILPWEPGAGWATDPPTALYAESSTAAPADFAVSITTPPGFDVLATGVPDGSGRWYATAVPDFALSVGHFAIATATVDVPQPVTVTVGVDRQVPEAPRAYLDRVVAALRDLSARYGPYPYATYTLAVQPNLRGGIEYPMHVMQGPRTTGRTLSHEVAHQWFYGLVANDQGRDPWLDEGLASWAEARHEDALASFLSRRVPPPGKNRLGQPMTYWERNQSSYYTSVYVQGVQALGALGPPDVVDCVLRQYVARTAYRVARPRDLLDAARLVVGDRAAAVLASFGVA